MLKFAEKSDGERVKQMSFAMVTKPFAFCHYIQCVWYWLKDCILECAQCQKTIIKRGGG